MKVKNPKYKQFLETNEIDIVTEPELIKGLDKVKTPKLLTRSMLITMYYTGGRPIEILSLKGSDISKEADYILIKMPASKRGLTRVIYLDHNKPLVKELWQYSRRVMPERYLFYYYRGNYKKINKKTGKEIIDVSAKLHYWFKKWFDFPPYYFRHNRFSKLSMAGMSIGELRRIKGARSESSVIPYIHGSKELGKKAAKITD